MATKPKLRKPKAEKSKSGKPAAEKTMTEKTTAAMPEKSSNISDGWQKAKETGVTYFNYLQIEKQAAAKTPRGTVATGEGDESLKRGRIWA